MSFEVLVPVITAVLGLASGFLIERYRLRATERVAHSSAVHEQQQRLKDLALEIVKLEIEHARAEGRVSQHPVVSHWVVVQALLEEQEVDLRSPGLQAAVNALSTRYRQICWTFPERAEIGPHSESKISTAEVLSEFKHVLEAARRSDVDD